MNCNNRACLYNLGDYQSHSELLGKDYNEINFDRYVGECTADGHNCEPSVCPINLCPRFIKDGLQTGNEFAPWFSIDVATGWHLSEADNTEYFKCLTKIRSIMHERTL